MTRAALKALKALLGAEGFSDHPADLEALAHDATGQAFWPEAVARPRTAEEVAGVVRLANEHGFAVVPRGAGSNRSGGTLVLRGGVVLSLVRLNKILEIHPGDMIARAEPGVILADLQAAADKLGLFYPPDPASRAFATLGGTLGECAGGLRAVKYGVTRDYVLGLTAVLGTGEVVRTGTRTLKGVVGYDLTRLLVGSEGTLAVITEATLKLIPKPPARASLIGLFPDLDSAGRACGEVFRAGLRPVALELLSRTVLSAVAGRLPVALGPGERVMLLAEVDGFPEAIRAEAQAVAEAFGAAGGRVVAAGDEKEAEDLWSVRRGVSVAIRKVKPLKFSEDVAVPRSRIFELVGRLEKLGQEMGLTIAAYGHAGDGNCHVNVLFESEAERSRAWEAVKRVFRTALDLGGTLSGEHGVGTDKAPYLSWELSPLEIDLMRRLKAVFDPRGVLNPGKIFPRPETAE